MTKVSCFSIDGILGNIPRTASASHSINLHEQQHTSAEKNIRSVTSGHDDELADDSDTVSHWEDTQGRHDFKVHHSRIYQPRQNSSVLEETHEKYLTESSEKRMRWSDGSDVTANSSNVEQVVDSQTQHTTGAQKLLDSKLQINQLHRHPLADPATLLNTLYPGLEQLVAMGSPSLRPGMPPHFAPSYTSASPLALAHLNRLSVAALQARPDLILPYDRSSALRCESNH